jgi:hypothetical protein
MKTHLIFIALLSSLATLAPSDVFAEGDEPQAIQDAKTKVYEMIGKDTTTLSFEGGSTNLSEADRKNLAAVVAAVRVNATISSAIIAAWSDKDYPSNKGQKLGSDQRRLADERATKIRKALNSLGISEVEAHSMAEQPGMLGKLFNTTDTMVKGEGKVDDPNDRFNEEIGEILRDHGGPGKAVVIIRRVGDQSAY